MAKEKPATFDSKKLLDEAKKETDPVRRAHLRRQAAGPAALVELTKRDDSKIIARQKLRDEVVKIGRDNQKKADAEGKKARAAELEAEASKKADEAKAAKEAAKAA